MAKPTGRPNGRPPIYTRELAEAVAELTAQGKTIRQIAATEGMPTHTTILKWQDEDTDGFAARLAHARKSAAAIRAMMPDERYQKAEEYLLETDDDGKAKNDPRRAAQLISLADKRDGYDRYLAGVLDPDTWAPASKVDVNAKVTVMALTAFADLNPPAPPSVDGNALEAVALPHVAPPDAVGGDESDIV